MSLTFPHGKRFLTGPMVANEEPALPPMRDQVVNFGKAVVRTVKAGFSGKVIQVDEETAASRFAICQACDLFRKADERCAHPKCACFLRLKTWLKAEKCPQGKW